MKTYTECQITFDDPYASECCPCDACVDFRNRITKEWREECERLAQISNFWQEKYYDHAGTYKRSKLDNL